VDRDEFVERCAVDVAFFAHNVIYKKRKSLSPKQIELMEALREHQQVGAVFNRQGGKTETFAVYDTHELCFGKSRDGDADHTILYAPILQQTEILMGRVHSFFASNPILEGFAEERNKYFIRMKNGNTLQAMSASEQSHVRGHSPTKIQIDESQDIADSMYYSDILPSGAATGAKIQETGTPKGRNHFYQLTRLKGDVRIVWQRWEECPFIDRAYVDMMKRKLPRAKFDAEFNCVFITENNVAFSTDLLDKIITIEPEIADKSKYKAFYLGGDIGKQDETVLTVFGAKEDGLEQVELRRLSAFESYKTVVEEITELCDEWDISLGLLDTTGVGEGVADLVPDHLPIEGVFLDSKAKQELVDLFLITAEKCLDQSFHLRLWKDYDLRQQFYEWESIPLKSGKKRYHHPKGGHDDIVISVLLAIQAFVNDSEVVNYGEASEGFGRIRGALDSIALPPSGLSGARNPFTGQ